MQGLACFLSQGLVCLPPWLAVPLLSSCLGGARGACLQGVLEDVLELRRTGAGGGEPLAFGIVTLGKDHEACPPAPPG